MGDKIAHDPDQPSRHRSHARLPDAVLYPGATLRIVPTRHPRHSITETPPVREALDNLRRRGERVRLGELVIRGARERLRELEVERAQETRNRELRMQLVERLRTGEGLDADAAYEVREHGWTH
jgi:hypothetical protein